MKISASIKLTYIILAHKNPRQLNRLVNTLSADHVEFVIHIDKDFPIKVFKTLFTHLDLKRIHFLRDRCQSDWGSFGIVQAILNCFAYIEKKSVVTDRIILLSGQDYPIKSNKYIWKYFAANKSTIFLNYFKVPYSKWNGGGEFRFPHFEEVNKIMPIYAGSQWMSFPVFVLPIIFSFLKLNPDFVEYFKNVNIPDESFFQTLLLNCDEAIINKNLVNQNLHLIKWDPPFDHPRNLDEKDYNLIRRSRFLFARKFLESTPSAILDKIDENILFHDFSLRNVEEHQLEVKPNQAILFLTDKTDKATQGAYLNLKEQSSKLANIFCLYHNKGKALPPEIAYLKPIAFNTSILKNLGFKGIYNKIVPGSNHFPLFQFYNENPTYKYYWFIEDDVRFNGNWDNFFSYFSKHDIASDLLTSHVRDYNEEPDWHWWEAINNSSGIRLPNKYRIRSFNPIFRISNQALAYLQKAFLSGWSGHHEITLPTLLNYKGFKINDFGGSGKYVLDGLQNKFYQSALPDSFGELKTGSMRFRPAIDIKEINNEFLYHPIKVS